LPVWVKPEHVFGQPFYVAHAALRSSKFGEQVVFKLRLRDGVYDADGDLHKIVHLSLSAGESGQRHDLVRYFKTSNDPLGPCILTEVPTKAGLNPFLRIEDVEPAALPAPLHSLPQLMPRQDTVADDVEELEDLPF